MQGQTDILHILNQGIEQVLLGSRHTCAVFVNHNKLVCWGMNYQGQTSIPSGFKKSVLFTLGSDHTCSVNERGVMECWGWDHQDQLKVKEEYKGEAVAVAGGD